MKPNARRNYSEIDESFSHRARFRAKCEIPRLSARLAPVKLQRFALRRFLNFLGEAPVF